jgi:two-component system, HptB-dependent secretion and biofilm response regulator
MTEKMSDRIGQALERQEHHVAFAITLMEHLVVPTFVLDAEQRVLIWNLACERLTGVPAAEVVGTRDHWRAFYEAPRPCLADLVATKGYEQIADLYTVFEDPAEPSFGVHAENWCWMPRRGERLYLAVDAGPVFDESGKLIAVVETLRDITEKHLAQTKVEEQASLLKAHFDEHQRETELARRILDHQIRSDLMQQAGVSYSVIPATNFSGDMVLAARAPSGRLYAILADATGHGLSAAVSVLPMVQEFYRLVEMSSPLNTVIESINFLLANSLPLGRFVAAAFVSLDEYAREGEIWVGGVPDVLLFDANGALERRFASNNLPLGIMRTNDGVGSIERFRWTHQGQLLLTSDGIAEASDKDGVQFGEERLHRAIKQKAAGETLIDALQRGLTEYLQGGHAHDDMSMLVIDCPA